MSVGQPLVHGVRTGVDPNAAMTSSATAAGAVRASGWRVDCVPHDLAIGTNSVDCPAAQSEMRTRGAKAIRQSNWVPVLGASRSVNFLNYLIYFGFSHPRFRLLAPQPANIFI
jgi:hypothetical protein